MTTNRIQIRTGLDVRKGNLVSTRQLTASDTMAGTPKGPTPGAVAIPVGGRSIDLTELETPGWCFIMNLDETNYVEVGIYDVGLDVFYPMLELGPGQGYPILLSRNLQTEYEGTGTGTTSEGNRLFLKANGGVCNVVIEAFEK